MITNKKNKDILKNDEVSNLKNKYPLTRQFLFDPLKKAASP